MSYKNYNLTDNVDDGFGFQIGEHKFTMRYPRVEEIEELQEVQAKVSQATDEEKAALTKQTQDYIYSFITADDGSDTKVEDVLKGHNIKVLQNFNNMVSAQFGVS